jgi:hypothetical protein
MSMGRHDEEPKFSDVHATFMVLADQISDARALLDVRL